MAKRLFKHSIRSTHTHITCPFSCWVHTCHYFLMLPFTDNTDFAVPSPFSITIPAGSIPSEPACVDIIATDDAVAEADHGFSVSLSQPSVPYVTVGIPESAIVTITDNEGNNILYID